MSINSGSADVAILQILAEILTRIREREISNGPAYNNKIDAKTKVMLNSLLTPMFSDAIGDVQGTAREPVLASLPTVTNNATPTNWVSGNVNNHKLLTTAKLMTDSSETKTQNRKYWKQFER